MPLDSFILTALVLSFMFLLALAYYDSMLPHKDRASVWGWLLFMASALIAGALVSGIANLVAYGNEYAIVTITSAIISIAGIKFMRNTMKHIA